MKKLTTLVVAVVALSVLAASPVHAAKIEIQDFKAKRFGAKTAPKNPHVYLSAYLRNNTAGKTKGGRYVLYRTVGSKLVELFRQNLTELAATGHRDIVGFAAPYSTAEERYVIKVFYENETTTAKCTLGVPKTYLTLLTLKCKAVNEGNDTPELRVYLPGKEHKQRWDFVNVGSTLSIKGVKNKEITRDISVQLWEIDSGSPDDKIGVVTIRRDAVGEKTHDFRSKEGWYTLKYRIDHEK